MVLHIGCVEGKSRRESLRKRGKVRARVREKEIERARVCMRVREKETEIDFWGGSGEFYI